MKTILCSCCEPWEGIQRHKNKIMNEIKLFSWPFFFIILITFASSGLSAVALKSGLTHCSTYLTGQRHTHTVHSHGTVSFLTSINRKLRRVDIAGRGCCTRWITACGRNHVTDVCGTVDAGKGQGWAGGARTRLGQVRVKTRTYWMS